MAGSSGALRTWLEARGGSISPHIEARRDETDGTGLYCRAHIASGTDLMVVPYQCMVTRNSLTKLALGDESIERLVYFEDDGFEPEVSDDFCLTVALLLAQNQSEWQAYWHTLPSLEEVAVSLPVTIKWESLNQTELSQVRDRIARACQQALGDRNLAQKLEEACREDRALVVEEYEKAIQLKAMHNVVLQDFVHARSLVTSRSFHVQMGQGERTDNSFGVWAKSFAAMIPFADMMNHGDDGTCGQPRSPGLQWRYNDAGGALVVYSIRNLQVGEQLLINYSATHSGTHPLEQRPQFYFFVHYGFFETAASAAHARL